MYITISFNFFKMQIEAVDIYLFIRRLLMKIVYYTIRFGDIFNISNCVYSYNKNYYKIECMNNQHLAAIIWLLKLNLFISHDELNECVKLCGGNNIPPFKLTFYDEFGCENNYAILFYHEGTTLKKIKIKDGDSYTNKDMNTIICDLNFTISQL